MILQEIPNLPAISVNDNASPGTVVGIYLSAKCFYILKIPGYCRISPEKSRGIHKSDISTDIFIEGITTCIIAVVRRLQKGGF